MKRRTRIITIKYGGDSLSDVKVQIKYLIHNRVGSDNVVSVRPQAGEGCWGIRFHFL